MDSQRFDRVAEVFDAARDLDEQARSEFLDKACARDGDLRSEVESLLAEYESSGDELEPLVHTEALRRWASDFGDETNEGGLPQVEIPGYRILSLIGEGGQGAVYEAEQDQPRRMVALKLLRPRLGGSTLERRFEREAQVLARLQHPGIATILDSGVVESPYGPLPYFALELIRGRTLVDSCEARGLSVAERVTLLAEVCDAVAHAHSKGVVHRDLKPSNVLVDEEGRARVLDFGIARLLDADLELATLETRTGQVIGTLAYMSPEQAEGQPADVDEQTDVFALGVIAFELLTGQLPRDLAGRPMPEQLKLLSEGQTTLLGSVDRSLRGDLETIIAKAMAQEKARRYRSATALAADLRRYLRKEPILARRATALYQLSRFVKRNRALSVSVCALAVALIAGTLVSLALYLDGRVSEAEALWQSYVANLTAAGAQLDAGTGGVAARLEFCPDEYKDTWEWRYLSRHSDTSLSQAESASIVHRVALGAQGLLASGGGRELPGDYGSPDFRVFLWKLDAAGQRVQFEKLLEPAHANAVRDLAFRPGGTDLVSLSMSDERQVAGEVHLWDTTEGTRIASLDCELHGILPTSLAWLPTQPDQSEAGRVAIASSSGVHIWEPTSGELQLLFSGSKVNVVTAQDAGSFTRLVVGTVNGTVEIWDMVGPAEAMLHGRVDLAQQVNVDAESYGSGVTSIEPSPDGESLLAGLEGGGLLLIDTQAGAPVASLRGHTRTVTALRWSTDGRFAWSTSLDKTLRRWDLERLECVEVRHGHAGHVTSLETLADPPLLVTGAYDRTLRVWDAGDQASVFRSSDQERSGLVYSLAFDRSGDALAWRPEKFQLGVSDLTTGSTSFTLSPFVVDSTKHPERYRGLILGVNFDPRGDALYAVYGFGGRLRRINARTGQLEATLGPELGAMRFVGFSQDGTRYAASTEVDGEWHLQVYGLETGELEVGCSWPTGIGSPTVGFTNGDRSVVHSAANRILVRDSRSGAVQQEFELPHQVNHLACSPSGEFVAATSYDPDDRALYVLDLKTGVIQSHEGNVKPFCLTFSHDSSRIVTGNRDDGTVSLWDVRRGLTLALSGLEGAIQWVAVSPDGRRIAAVDSAGVHRVWDAGPNGLDDGGGSKDR